MSSFDVTTTAATSNTALRMTGVGAPRPTEPATTPPLTPPLTPTPTLPTTPTSTQPTTMRLRSNQFTHLHHLSPALSSVPPRAKDKG